MSNESVQEMARMAQADKPEGGAPPQPLFADVAGSITVHSDGHVSVSLHGLTREIFNRLPGTEAALPGEPGAWVKDVIEQSRLSVHVFTHEPPTKESAPCLS